MGFLSFLSRNTSNDQKSIKSQAYHATVAAVPPVRGSYPLAGNSSTDALQRAVRKFSNTEVPTSAPEPWLPPPSFRRPRATSDARPSTAKLETNEDFSVRPKSAGRNSRYFSGNGPPYLLNHPLRKQTYQDPIEPVPPVPPVADLVRRPGYVDILDAQSDLKPSNFRARIEATGVRDYGEDVAERNIGGGILLAPSPAVRELRTGVASRASSVPPKSSNPKRLSGVAYTPSTLSDDSDHSAPAPVIATGSEAKKKLATRRRRSQRLGKKSAVTSPTTSSRASSHARLYRSAPGGSQTSLVLEDKSSSLHKRSKTADLDVRVAARRISTSTLPSTTPTARPKPRPLSLYPNTSSQSYDEGATPPSVPRYRHQPTSSVDVQRNKFTKNAPVATTRSQRRASSVDVNMDNFLSRLNTESRLWDSSSDDEESYFPSKSLPASRSGSRPASRGNHATANYHGNRNLASPDLGNSMSFEPDRSRSRAKSLGGIHIPRRPQLYDISEHIPTRDSSLAPKSSSTTLTTIMSAEYSNYAPFTRPQSQHTANTSVDYSGKSTSASDTSPSLKSGGRPPSSAYYTAMEDDINTGMVRGNKGERGSYNGSHGYGRSISSRLDQYEYPSSEDSDTDSFVEATHKKQRDGEALLFRSNGYGGKGNDLPGLTEMLHGIDMDEPDWERHLSVPTNQDWYVGTRLRSPDATKRLRMPFMDSESEIETVSNASSSINEAEFVSDVGEEQAKAIKHMRLSAMGGVFPKLVGNAIDTGRVYDRGTGAQDSIKAGDEWTNVGAAMKLRKELKRQQRSRERSQSCGRGGAVRDAERGKYPI